MGYQGFKELRVWQEAKELAIKVYEIARKGKLATDYGLKDQIQRSAVSVASNIAEGYERNSDKEFVRFLLISKGSLSELRTQIEIAHGIGYLDDNTYELLENQSKKLGAMLTKFIKSRSSD